MNRAPLHGAPVRGQAPPPRGPARGNTPSYGNQDARSNFAVQPAANAGTGSIKLKKAAVKIVGAAAPAPAPNTSVRAAVPPSVAHPAGGSSPVPGPFKAKAKEPERVAPAKRTPPKVESPTTTSAEESELDSMFARLSTGGPSTPSSTKVAAPSSGPAASEFSFEDRPAMKDVGPTQVVESKATSSSAPSAKGKEPVSAVVSTSQEKEFKKVEHTKDISQKDLEQLYLRKAAEYLGALPSVNDVSVQLIKTVTNKLRNTYTPDAKLSTDEAEILKNRYVFAIVNYINQVLKKTATPIKAEDVKKALQDCDGNILALYGALVGKSHLAIDDIEGITDLFKMIQDVLPNAEPITAPTISQVKPTATAAEFNPASKDPMDKLKAWPTQEKREDPAQHRACILKGVSGVKSINELQALVWGGRLESIAMPPPGSGFAVVRFLTPEACEKFFKATENGIEVQGDLKKAVVFVEKQPGPSSINDVMRNCIEGDASRCVRALDAEEDWSDILLMKLARGKGVGKREVDRIKRGKTARGRYYIEFRFANIYHALNFKKMLMDDPDWETCTISYAADPCESANGVHYKDEDD